MSSPSDQESGDWLENRGFGALDWASAKHSVVVIGPHGKVLEDFEIDHSALGWKKFRERMKLYGSIPFAIETSQGASVEQLLEAGMQWPRRILRLTSTIIKDLNDVVVSKTALIDRGAG